MYRACLLSLAFFFLFFNYAEFVTSQESSEDSPTKLEEVIVEGESEQTDYAVEDAATATKTETPIEEIPQSIEVIDRNLIDDQRAEQLQDIVYNVAGAVPGDSNIIPYTMRGFRAQLMKDGFTYTNVIFLNVFLEELTNVERVEFLNGPSSVLYGNAAPGGLINIITKTPLPYFYASAEGTIGSYDFYRGQIDVTGPITKDKSLLFRLSGSYRNSDSFRDFIYSERVFLAPVISWQINPNMNLILQGEYQYIDQPFDDGIVAVGDKVADIPISRNLAEPTDHTSYKSYLGRAVLETNITKDVLLRNAFRYYRAHADTFDHKSAVLLPDNRTLERIIFDSTLDNDMYTFRNDLIVNFDTGPLNHKVLFGIEYINDDTSNPGKFIPSTSIDIYDPVYGSSEVVDPSDVPLLKRRVKTNDLGFYIQDQITIYNKLFLLAGIRYDYINQDILDNGLDPTEKSRRFNNEDNEFSPRLGILYEPIDGLSFYGNYSRSFFLIVANAFSLDGSFLNPETSDQYEAGVKLNLFEDRLSSTASIFRINKKNALTPDPFIPVFAVQVDKERSQGFEINLTAQPVNGLSLIGSYAFIDAEVVKDDIFPSGNELASVPRNSGSLWATYRFYKGPIKGFGLGGGLIGVGKRQGDLMNTFELDGFLRVDAALYYEKAIDGLGIINASLNFKNITDEKYIVVSDSRVSVVPGEPFSVFGTLKWEF